MSLFALLVFVVMETVLAGWVLPLQAAAKISPQEREQMSYDAAMASQRAYAPKKERVAKFLALEAQAKGPCPRCDDKDFSDPCPLGWDELMDGRCKAPLTYTGVCNEVQTFIATPVAAKMELEMTCGVCWPCTRGGQDETATCTRDWARPCPYGYSPQDIAHGEFHNVAGVTCEADFSYEGECEQRVLFKDIEAKKEFAERCKTSWPCQRVCQDGFAVCPEGWQSLGDGQCMAPDSYKQDSCPLAWMFHLHGSKRLQSFRGWTNTNKSDFASKCGVAWPCAVAADSDGES